MNERDATVGSLLGDGLVLTFSNPGDVGIFYVCLLINSNTSAQKYPVADFGYSTRPYQFIYPLSTETQARFEFSSWMSTHFIFSYFLFVSQMFPTSKH